MLWNVCLWKKSGYTRTYRYFPLMTRSGIGGVARRTERAIALRSYVVYTRLERWVSIASKSTPNPSYLSAQPKKSARSRLSGAWHELEDHSCGRGHVICIEPTADLAAAAKLLFTHRIGVLVVLDGSGRLAGILSERDIVRAMAESGRTVLQLPVAQVMTRNVSTCDVNDSISSVIDRMTTGKFRHMPVLDQDRLAGLVSIGAALKWHIETIREHIHQIEESLIQFELGRL